MRVSAELPRGVVSLFGEAARRRRAMEERAVGVLADAGYDEVVLPVLDYASPYEELLGEAGRAEIYRFVDRRGELLALCADFTPMLARLLAPRLAGFELPLRLFYRGDVVRCREAEAGRHEESFQIGAELLGLAGALGEAEAVALFLRLLAALAPGRARVVLGVAGALDELLARAPDPAAAAEAVRRREREALRGLPPALLEVVRDGLPRETAALGAAGAAAVERVVRLRDELAARHPDVELGIDLAELAAPAGGREGDDLRSYYQGLVFRAFVARRAVPVGGGGRYDRLWARLGAPVPAVGFSLDVDRLGLAAAERAAASGALLAGGVR